MENIMIEKHLAEIEEIHRVRILFASESGSRAWGFESPDSDWDVRFLYVHPLEWYLRVNPGRDVIEKVDNDGFDASGWELRKALLLFVKTNMTLNEWLNSPIIYRDDMGLRNALTRLQPLFFNVTRAMYHYHGIARSQQNRYLDKRGTELKRFLYFLRSMLACKWIAEKGTPPPLPFMELADALVAEEDIRSEVAQILRLKRSGREHDKQTVSPTLQEYGRSLEREAEWIRSMNLPKHPCHNGMEKELDRLLFETVTAAFGKNKST